MNLSMGLWAPVRVLYARFAGASAPGNDQCFDSRLSYQLVSGMLRTGVDPGVQNGDFPAVSFVFPGGGISLTPSSPLIALTSKLSAPLAGDDGWTGDATFEVLLAVVSRRSLPLCLSGP